MFGKRKAEDASRPTLRCSFCNKSDRDVRKLIAGPKVFICDECVEVCVDIIADDAGSTGVAQPEPPVSQPPSWPTSVWCTLCRMPLVLEESLAVPERGLVCRPCVSAVHATALAAGEVPQTPERGQ